LGNWIRAPRTEIQEIYEKLGDLVADGSLAAVVEHMYPLEQFGSVRAIFKIESQRQDSVQVWRPLIDARLWRECRLVNGHSQQNVFTCRDGANRNGVLRSGWQHDDKLNVGSLTQTEGVGRFRKETR
jgi:hypothetical protein